MNRWAYSVERWKLSVNKEPNENARNKKRTIIEFLQVCLSQQSRGKNYGSKLGNKKEMIQTEMQREKILGKKAHRTERISKTCGRLIKHVTLLMGIPKEER